MDKRRWNKVDLSFHVLWSPRQTALSLMLSLYLEGLLIFKVDRYEKISVPNRSSIDILFFISTFDNKKELDREEINVWHRRNRKLRQLTRLFVAIIQSGNGKIVCWDKFQQKTLWTILAWAIHSLFGFFYYNFIALSYLGFPQEVIV